MTLCAAIDRNGYLPVHNRIYSHPQKPGDVAFNTANSRNRRIFNDAAGLAAHRPVCTGLRDAKKMISGPMMMVGGYRACRWHAHDRHRCAQGREPRDRSAMIVAIDDEFGTLPRDDPFKSGRIVETASARRADAMRRMMDHDDPRHAFRTRFGQHVAKAAQLRLARPGPRAG